MNKWIALSLLLVLAAILWLATSQGLFAAEKASVAKPVDLRCELLENPLGIDVTTPRLTWKVEAPGAQGTKQLAYPASKHCALQRREASCHS